MIRTIARLVAGNRRFYNAAQASLALCDGPQVFALIRDNICASNQLDPVKIDHIAVILTDKDGKVKMITAEAATSQSETQWCSNREHKKQILRGLLASYEER